MPTWDQWDNSHIENCRVIAEIDNEVVGWSALSPVSSHCVYGGVAEVSVYVSPKFSEQKVGTQSLEKLIIESEKNKIWTLQASVFQKT